MFVFIFLKTIRQKRANTLWNTAISQTSHKSTAASKSTSTGAQYVTLDNKIKCLSLAFYFGNLTNKTVTAYMWRLLIANHLDQSLWSTNQKYRSNLLHSFLEVHNCVAPFTSHDKLHEFGVEKPISWAQPAHFNFFWVTFTVWTHILNTFGDAQIIVTSGYPWPLDTMKSPDFFKSRETHNCTIQISILIIQCPIYKRRKTNTVFMCAKDSKKTI
jgi:hypothetical protein